MDRFPLDEPGVPQAIAIVVVRGGPESRFSTPDYSDAAGAGALRGGLGTAMVALQVLGAAPLLLLFPPTAAILAGAVAVGAVGGAAIGASVVVPPDEVAAFQSMMDSVVAELRLPELTADAVELDLLRWTPYRVDVVDVVDGAAAPSADARFHRSLRDRGFGGALEIRITAVGFTGRGGSDPGIHLFLDAEARLVDTATGEPTALRGLVYLSPPHEESAWTRESGALAKAELARAYHSLAERIVEHFVLQSEVFAGNVGMPSPRTCGVVPVEPKLDWDGEWAGRPRPTTPVVPSRNPSLAWQGTPASIATSYGKRWAPAKADDMRYDLRIWNAVDDAPADLVYEREGIAATEHRVELALEQGATYFWSVRIRYAVEGKPRATRWSAANVPPFVPPVPFGDALQYSHVDAGAAKPVRCEHWDLTPCGCLDFIPRQNHYRFKVE